MFKKIVALLLGLQLLTFPAGATTTYKICGLPDAVAVADTDHFELSRNCGGSYNATGAELATYFIGKAPGANGQIITNQNGKFAALSPAATNTLLGLAPVATSGAYGSLTGTPSLATVATSGSYVDLSNKPTIPAAQVASDWNATTGVAAILNKPTLGTLAALGSVNDANWSGTALSLANGGTGAKTQNGAQTALGLVPGTNVQSYSAELTGVSGLSATGYLQRTGAGAYTASASVPLSAVAGAGTAAAAATGTSGAALGLLNGNLTFSGSDTFSGVTTHTALDVHNLNTGAARAAQAGAVIQVANADGANTRIENDAFGASAFFSGVRWDGTNNSPTGLVLGDEITGFGALGYNGTAVSALAAAVRLYAGGTWSASSNPTYIDLLTTPVAATAAVPAVRLQASGGLSVPSTAADMGAGTVNATALYQAGVQVATGATSSTDRTLPRFSGATGKTLLPSNIAVSDNDEISGYRNLVVTDTTTARTLAATDRGTTIIFTNSAAITVTLPAALISGFNVEIIQGGTGQITFIAASGATLTNAHAQTKTYAAAGASVRLVVTGNSGGSAAAYNLAGDTGS